MDGGVTMKSCTAVLDEELFIDTAIIISLTKKLLTVLIPFSFIKERSINNFFVKGNDGFLTELFPANSFLQAGEEELSSSGIRF